MFVFGVKMGLKFVLFLFYVNNRDLFKYIYIYIYIYIYVCVCVYLCNIFYRALYIIYIHGSVI